MKRIAWVILGWSALLATTQAASFDCAKASSNIEKLICSNPKLSTLDEELDKSYKGALSNSRLGKTDQIVSAQKQWLKQTRNKCTDELCLNTSYSSRIKELKEVYQFFGVYQGLSRACENSILKFSPMTITLDDCRDVPYDVIESDINHVRIKSRDSTACTIAEFNLARQFALGTTKKQPKGFGNVDVGGCIFAPRDPAFAEDQSTNFLNGKTGKDRKDALNTINAQDKPDRQKYNKLGLKDSSPEVRATAAYSLNLKLAELTPILLTVITGDTDPEVRLHAALNLHRQFCYGGDYEPKDAEVLVSDLPMLEKAIRNEDAGRYVVEILDQIWCDIPENSRKPITSVLASKLPYGHDTVGIDDLAKQLLITHTNDKCP